MASAKQGLGRGLEALLGPQSDEGQPGRGLRCPFHTAPHRPGARPSTSRARAGRGRVVRAGRKHSRPGHPWPILVRKLGAGPQAGQYEIIAGERRFRAATLAGLTDVPVLVRDVPDETAAAMALIENIQREDQPTPAGRGPRACSAWCTVWPLRTSKRRPQWGAAARRPAIAAPAAPGRAGANHAHRRGH